MRRPNGTGTIVKLSGNRRKPYAVRIPSRDRRGYVVQKALGYYVTASAAQLALDGYNAGKAAGTAPAADKLSMTVQEVYDQWSAREYHKKGKASVVSHKAAWNKRISRFAERKIRDITLDEWQSILDEDEDNGLSQSTINNDATMIRALCGYAAMRDIIGKDYSEYLDVPSVDPKHEKGAFTDLQIKQIEDMAASGVPWADAVLMLCYTGLRISEFLSLTRFNYHEDKCVGYLQGGMKTPAGKDRIIPVHPKIKPYLLSWIARGGETIVCEKNGAPIPSYRFRESYFPHIVAALGMPQASPHWCRHTFATRAKHAKVDTLAIKRIMGHSDRDVTDGYTHTDLSWLVSELLKIA